MTKEEKRAMWEYMISRAQADLAHYAGQPEYASAFGRRFREQRLAECETLLAVDAILRERTGTAAAA